MGMMVFLARWVARACAHGCCRFQSLMRRIFRLIPIAGLLLWVACTSSDFGRPWVPHKPAAMSFLGNWAQGRPVDPAPTRADVAYGEHSRHRFDFWAAPGEGPRPLFVYFHGGGFDFGNKWELRSSVVRALLDRGVSVVSCNYRLVKDGPLPQPIHDGARAVQYLRHHAAEFGVDPRRMAGGGFSAGGLMALWLTLHDDLADPGSDDPIARQSTRLACAAVCDAPTNLVAPEVYAWFGVPVLREYPSARRCFDISSIDQLRDPAIVALARRVSPWHHVTPDDPPVYISHTGRNSRVTRYTRPTTWVHHPQFGIKLQERMVAAGIECTLHYRDSEPPKIYRDGVDFIARQLGKPSGGDEN